MFCAQQDVEKSMQLPTTNTLIDVAPGGPDLVAKISFKVRKR